MTHSRTAFHFNLCWPIRIAAWVVLAASGVCAAHAGVWVQPVVDPSPMIERGHLEGGVNGEGSPQPDGKTPLMLAVEANDLKVIEYLLQRGADPDLKNSAGETALDLARRRMMREAADLLSAHAAAHLGFSAYYAGKSPVLSITGVKSQSGSPDCGAAHPLELSVADRDGKPLADAPVRFTVEGGGRCLLTQASSPDSASLLLRSDGEGRCRANVHLPKEPNARIHIIASVGEGEQESKVTFTALTNDGAGGDSITCFDPTDIQAVVTPTGECDVSWQNHTDDETAIEIWEQTGKGRKLVAKLPPHSTFAHLPRISDD